MNTNCPHCRAATLIPPECEGIDVECPTCRRTFRAPTTRRPLPAVPIRRPTRPAPAVWIAVLTVSALATAGVVAAAGVTTLAPTWAFILYAAVLPLYVFARAADRLTR